METDNKKIRINMDGKELFLDDGLSILDAARQNNIHIPTLCHHPHLSPWGGCRLCSVEVDGSSRLVASCVTPVRDGMEILTATEQVIQSRRTILEFLFAERNHNCMVCPDSGRCELQRLAYELQMDHLTIPASFDKFSMDMTSPYMAFDHNRCILCGRCVRACREISGARVLNFINRGPESLIGFDLHETRENSTCHSCGACLQVCPTGAIVNRLRSHYAVRGHDVEKWQKIQACCPLCGLLCSCTYNVSDNTLLSVDGSLESDMGRPDRGQLCVRGRFEVLRTKGPRLTLPLIQNKEGNWEKTGWETAVDLAAKKFNGIRDTSGGDAIFGMASSMCANETLLLFYALLSRGWKSKAIDTLDGAHFRTLLKTRDLPNGNFQEASWKMIPRADFILMVGVNSCQQHPVIRSLIHRSILENGTKLGIIGPPDGMLPFVTFHLPVNKGEESLLITAMLKERQGGTEASSRIIHHLHLDEKAVKTFHEMVNAFADAANPLILTGEGLTGLKDAVGLQDAVTLSRLKGRGPDNGLGIIILKPYGNSAGAWQLKIPSTQDPLGANTFKGGLLLLSGEEDPSLVYPDPVRSVDYLAVISPFFPDSLAKHADIIIPNPIWIEEEGTYCSLDGRERVFKQRVLFPPTGVTDTHSVLSALAKKAGLNPA